MTMTAIVTRIQQHLGITQCMREPESVRRVSSSATLPNKSTTSFSSNTPQYMQAAPIRIAKAPSSTTLPPKSSFSLLRTYCNGAHWRDETGLCDKIKTNKQESVKTHDKPAYCKYPMRDELGICN